MSAPIEDFRRRTARLRRERTGRRLVTALFEQADLLGVAALTVDDIRTAADMARGSFYRHFPTLDALLDHAGGAVGAQVNSEMSARFDEIADPALRISQHVRYLVRRATSDRVCAQLFLRIVTRDGEVSDFARDHAVADVREGIATGRFSVPSATVAAEMGNGMVTAMLRRAAISGHDSALLRSQVGMLLRAFGVEADDAQEVASAPLPRPPRESLRELVLQLCSELTSTASSW